MLEFVLRLVHLGHLRHLGGKRLFTILMIFSLLEQRVYYRKI